MKAILTHYSSELAKAFSKGSVAFHSLGGATKLPYSLSLLHSFLCNYHSFLDDDDAGRKGFADAQKSLLASDANTTFSKCLGMSEAEFEDLLREDVYVDYFQAKYAVDVRHAPFDLKAKWSKRIRHGLTKAGKSSATGEVWPDKNEYEDKRAIAELVVKNPGTAIHPAREELIKSFAATLESKLKTLAAIH